MPIKDLTGHKFGRLLVLSRAPNDRHQKAWFECRCDCGTVKNIAGYSLSKGHTKSCGCWRIDLPAIAFKTHGMRRTAEYRAWCHMKTRCLNPETPAYQRYGGRGITICAEWAASFEAFFNDMGPRPSRLHSVDRKNNDLGYEPGNCRWSMRREQASNRSTVKMIEHDGVADTMAGWSRRTGIPYLKLRRRLVDGWSPARAMADAALRAVLFKEGM